MFGIKRLKHCHIRRQWTEDESENLRLLHCVIDESNNHNKQPFIKKLYRDR